MGTQRYWTSKRIAQYECYKIREQRYFKGAGAPATEEQLDLINYLTNKCIEKGIKYPTDANVANNNYRASSLIRQLYYVLKENK